MASVTRAIRDVVSPRTWRATAQLVVELPAGIASFVVMVTLISLTFGLLVIVPAALVTAALAFASARLIGWLGRWRAKALLDLDIDAPHRPLPPKGWWAADQVAALRGLHLARGRLLAARPPGRSGHLRGGRDQLVRPDHAAVCCLPPSGRMPDHAVYVAPVSSFTAGYAAGPAFLLGLVLLLLAALVVLGAAAVLTA